MSAVPQTAGWQAGFLQLLPAVQTHASIRFRRLPAQHREEAVQEAIAAACVGYQRAAARGTLDLVRPGPLAAFAVRHVRQARHVGGRQDVTKDVMSPACHRRHGVRVCSFSGARSGDGTDGWRQMAVADRKVPVADLAAFCLDFAAWLRTLSRRDRRIVDALIDGEGTAAVAGRFGLTAGRVSQLRRKYERLWLVFQGEAAAAGQWVA